MRRVLRHHLSLALASVFIRHQIAGNHRRSLFSSDTCLFSALLISIYSFLLLFLFHSKNVIPREHDNFDVPQWRKPLTLCLYWTLEHMNKFSFSFFCFFSSILFAICLQFARRLSTSLAQLCGEMEPRTSRSNRSCVYVIFVQLETGIVWIKFKIRNKNMKRMILCVFFSVSFFPHFIWFEIRVLCNLLQEDKKMK